MKPKLYQYAACPFCNKVSTLLAYKKVDYDVIEVNPLNKKEIEFSTDYRKVPIYINSEGKQITDSNSIMKAIDEEFPIPRVFSDDAIIQARDEKWLVWSEKLVQGLPTIVYGKLGDSFEAFNYILKTGKFGWFQARMIKYSGAMIMNLVAKKIRKRENIEDPEVFVSDMLKEWSEGLEGRSFMGGEIPSVSDFAVFGIIRAVASLRAGKIIEKNVVFYDWFSRMLEQTELSAELV